MAAPVPAGGRRLGTYGDHPYPAAGGRPRDPVGCTARCVGAACREEPSKFEAVWPEDRDRRAFPEDSCSLEVMASSRSVRRTAFAAAAVLTVTGSLRSQ